MNINTCKVCQHSEKFKNLPMRCLIHQLETKEIESCTVNEVLADEPMYGYKGALIARKNRDEYESIILQIEGLKSLITPEAIKLIERKNELSNYLKI